MPSTSKEITDRPDSSAEDHAAPQSREPSESFLWRQFIAAGLTSVAEKVAAGRDLELEDVLTLSRASLPLLGKMVELRSLANDTGGAAVRKALPIDRVAALPQSPRHVGQAPTDWESFCRTLIALRGEFSSSAAATVWYPSLGTPLDRDDARDGDFTAVEVLRAIALARLVLPTEIQVQAPLATLGAKLAQVALDFGASHLGYMAFDGQTSNDPLVADPSVLDELTESCLPTTLKEEPGQTRQAVVFHKM